ncbi:iron-sulfur cluster assembly protein [Nonomuraea rosea]|uniref:Iron-sulfur cluster assembly protein n=1 Tax=Nonomuraea rosea TaxID=638574 RepID=A0ABP6YZ00_9ACTN
MTAVNDGSRILAALATVRDPELDEPITALGFVASCALSADGRAEVRLRLPTYFCAPNFAFLMVADAHDAVSAMEGVRHTEVVLEDHFAAEAINDGVAARAGFQRSFAGEAAGELDQLRADFLRKAVLAGTDQVCRSLLTAAPTPDTAPAPTARPGGGLDGGSDGGPDSGPDAGSVVLARLTLGDVPGSPALDRLRQRRRELGLPAGDDAPLLIDPATGAPIGADAVPRHLRRARTTRVGIEANTGICRGMLRHRYQDKGEGEEDR